MPQLKCLRCLIYDMFVIALHYDCIRFVVKAVASCPPTIKVVFF